MSQFTVDAARGLGGPPWLRERRTEAAESFAASDAPSASAEEWRYSPIADLDLSAYKLVPRQRPRQGVVASGRCGAHEDRALHDAYESGALAAVCEVANGRIVNFKGRDRLAAAGVRVAPLGDAGGESDLLGAVADGAPDYFTVFNDAFARSPIIVDVPDGAVVGEPIALRHHDCGVDTASFPRLVVRIGAGAQATVLDVHHSAGPALVVPVVEPRRRTGSPPRLPEPPTARSAGLADRDPRRPSGARRLAGGCLGRPSEAATPAPAPTPVWSAGAPAATCCRPTSARATRSSTSAPTRTTPPPTPPPTCSTRARWATRLAASTPG